MFPTHTSSSALNQTVPCYSPTKVTVILSTMRALVIFKVVVKGERYCILVIFITAGLFSFEMHYGTSDFTSTEGRKMLGAQFGI